MPDKVRVKRKHVSNFLTPKTGQTIPEMEKMDAGMIINFVYTTAKIDKEPLLFLMYVDKSKKILHGVNLNYLVKEDINFFFKSLENLGVEAALENHRRLQYEYIRFQFNTKFSPNRFDGKVVYHKLFPMNKKLGRAYRSYSLKNMSRTKLVNFKIETLVGKQILAENTWLER